MIERISENHRAKKVCVPEMKCNNNNSKSINLICYKRNPGIVWCLRCVVVIIRLRKIAYQKPDLHFYCHNSNQTIRQRRQRVKQYNKIVKESTTRKKKNRIHYSLMETMNNSLLLIDDSIFNHSIDAPNSQFQTK